MHKPARALALEVRQVSHHYGPQVILDQVSLCLEQGTVAALVGPSGVGKSTLLRLVAGIEAVQSGRILIHGAVAGAEGVHREPAHRGLGMVFQEGALFPHLTVEKNILFGHRGHRNEKAHRLDHLARVLGLEALLRRFPHQLSGGQQQRVALARALAKSPPLLLMDEAFAGMDRGRKMELLPELARLFQAEGTSVLLVSHDAEEALALTQRLLVLEQGRLVCEGELCTLAREHKSAGLKAFLGGMAPC